MALPTRRTSSDSSGATNKPKTLGNVPVLVDSFDPNQNRIEGTNLRNGEPIEIRFATASDIAENYMNKNQIPSQEERLRKAEGQIKDRPDLRKLNSMVADGLDGQVIQMQGVRETYSGDLMARWAKPITADKEKDIALRGEIEYVAVQTDKGEWRQANVTQPRKTEPLNEDSLQRHFANKAYGHDGEPAEGFVQSRPLITIRDENGELAAGYIYTQKTSKDAGPTDFHSGPDALKNIKLSRYNAVVLAATAGRLDMDLKDFKGYDDLPQEHRDIADAMHKEALTDGGNLEITITPGFNVNLLDRRHDAVLASETNNSKSGPLTNRGSFEADISLRTYKNPETGDVLPARVKEAVETSPLKHPDSSDFYRRNKMKIAEFSMKIADHNEEPLNVAPGTPEQQISKKLADEQSREAAQEQEKDQSMGAPTMGGM